MRKIGLISFLFLISSCTSFQLRPDPAPSPIDPNISQARLEFQGCRAEDSQIGTIACLPGDKLSIVTEFPGTVIYFSSGDKCSVRVEARATLPKTEIQLPTFDSICPLVVYYLPDYPKASSSVYPIKGLFGEVSLQPDSKYEPFGNFSITTSEILKIQFPNAVRGAFISRQLSNPQTFEGDTLAMKPALVGLDLIQVKLWMADGSNQFKVVPGNFFSPFALQILFDPVLKPKKLEITFPEVVSIVTVNHEIHTELKLKLEPDFTGEIRAYTVQGRTLLAKYSKGVLQWVR
jgi:hypothetical protein